MIVELFAAVMRLALWVIAISFIVWIFRNATRPRSSGPKHDANPQEGEKPTAKVEYHDVKDANFTDLPDDRPKSGS